MKAGENDRKYVLTNISWPIQAKETLRYTAQTAANAMQNGETANVRYERAPKKGILTYDSPACLNHLCEDCNFSFKTKNTNFLE